MGIKFLIELGLVSFNGVYVSVHETSQLTTVHNDSLNESKSPFTIYRSKSCTLSTINKCKKGKEGTFAQSYIVIYIFSYTLLIESSEGHLRYPSVV